MSAKLNVLSLSLLLSIPLASSALERTTLLPPDAQTYVRVSNTTNFWNKLKQSSLGKLWVDQQFQDFIGNPDAETWQELIFEGDTDAESKMLVEQVNMLKGEVILAFGMDMEDPCIIAAMDAADFQRSLEMDEKLVEITEEPLEIVRSTFQDVKITEHIKSGGTPGKDSSWQAHVGTTFVLGYSREWIERCIVQLKKEEIKEPEGNPVCNLNLPISKLIQKFIEDEKKDSANNPSMLDTELIFEALGLMGIESYQLKVELKEAEMVVDSNLLVSDLNKGIFSILDLQPSELPSVGFIPENIASFEVGRANLLRFWQEIPAVLTTAMPTMKPQFDMILAIFQQQAGINFEQDLLANLGTEYISFSVVDGSKQTSTVAVELKDGMAFKTGLETALSSPALQPQLAAALEIEEFLDHTIYTVKNTEPGNPIAFSVTGEYFLYGHPAGIRQVIRCENSDAPTAGSYENAPLVKGMRQHVPARAFGFGAVDWKKNMAIVIRELTKPEVSQGFLQGWAKSGSALPPPDFGKLPPADHIASFFNVSYQYAEATPNGIHQKVILKY
ncbi:MAG: hypothetical protein ABFR47_05090 [Verrucomicrobiota bacterium]